MREGTPVSLVFFCQAVVSQHLCNESRADVEAHVGKRLSDLIHIEIGLEARADDARFDLLGAFEGGAWGRAFGQEVGQRTVEDDVADVVVGLARLEAKAGGELALGEVAEFAKDDHADLLLDSLFLGKSDGFPGRSSEHEGAVFDLNVDIERDLHGHALSCGRIDDLGRCGSAADMYTPLMHKVKDRVTRRASRRAARLSDLYRSIHVTKIELQM